MELDPKDGSVYELVLTCGINERPLADSIMNRIHKGKYSRLFCRIIGQASTQQIFATIHSTRARALNPKNMGLANGYVHWLSPEQIDLGIFGPGC